ncbi:hypothetical protein DGWBC_0188 [Dehalogenimonas sp. WBC-2]|nr:hypothetical protein DGWBC_0188 [Dehalogenimonas sp. WBC-2]
MINEHNSNRNTRGGISGGGMFAIILVTILICCGVSLGLTSTLAAPKSEYASEIASINNSLGHLKDSTSNLDSFLTYQNDDVQSKIFDLENDILVVNADLANNNTKDDTQNTAINALKIDVNSIGSLQVIPTVTPIQRTLTNGDKIYDSGTISLAINSSQSMASQIVAFRVEFTPIGSTGPILDEAGNPDLDWALQQLYASMPIELKPGGSDKLSIPVDHIQYNVYFTLGGYYLKSIEFTTKGTSISKGSQTKILAYTLNNASINYDVKVTPIFEAKITTSNENIPVW